MNHHMHGHGRHGGVSKEFYCVCPSCDFYTEHVPGVPCRTLVCPDCGSSLERGEVIPEQSLKGGLPYHRVIPRERIPVPFPVVVADKCTACGICIDICPTHTIVMRDNKAIVEVDNCRNCRVCIARCPEKAIILGTVK